MVVGSGHSAVNTLINLSKLKRKNPNTTIVWVLRKKEVSETFSTPKDKILGRYKLEEKIEQLVSKGYIRSEERRVGKECRYRWLSCTYKKKTQREIINTYQKLEE